MSRPRAAEAPARPGPVPAPSRRVELPDRPPRRRDLQATRRALLDAAAAVFVRRGFAAASLDEIAEHAGFTRGAVHHHFSSKEELFLAVVAERDEELLAGYGDVGWFGPERTADVDRWRTLHGDGRVDVGLRLELHAHALRSPGVRSSVAAVEDRAVAATAERLAERTGEAGLRWRVPVDHVAELLHVASRGLLERAVVAGDDLDAVAPVMVTLLELIWGHAVEEDR